MNVQVGTHGNAWNAASVGAAGKSTAVELHNAFNVTAFGNTSGASTLTLEVSQNGTTWYAHPTSIAANGDFAQSWQIGAKWARLSSSAAVTITATLAAK